MPGTTVKKGEVQKRLINLLILVASIQKALCP
jgi:hypothetical protein